MHERGARHMADPSRLVESATRLYGDEMDRLWGEMRPVPEDRLHSLVGGETLFDGAFEVAYTPGHASHHVSYRHGDTAFVGDVGGVRITPDSIVVPPTPPPDIDVEAWQRSIAVLRSWSPARLAMTHFGDSTDVTAQLDELEARLDAWSALAREGDRDRFIATVQAEILSHGSPEQAADLPAGRPGRAALRRLRALLEPARLNCGGTGGPGGGRPGGAILGADVDRAIAARSRAGQWDRGPLASGRAQRQPQLL